MAARATRRRVVLAPEDSSSLPAVLSVELDEDEEVRWIWTHANGESAVTGYTIVEKNGP